MLEDYCWLTLAQIHKLISQDNLVNMDARSILSCISFAASELQDITPTKLNLKIKKLDAVDANKIPTDLDSFQSRVIASAIDSRGALHDSNEIISWYEEKAADIAQTILNPVRKDAEEIALFYEDDAEDIATIIMKKLGA